MFRNHGKLLVAVLGANHKTASLHARETLSRHIQEAFSLDLVRHPSVILSTCNRIEIYFSADSLEEAYHDFLPWFKGSLIPYRFFGIDCFLHLARVISGLDSAVLAETEIQRQVKVAYTGAMRAMQLPGCLHYIFQKGLRIGKLVRNKMVLEQGNRHFYAAIHHIAHAHLGTIQDKSLLIVGYSSLGRGLIDYFRKLGVAKIAIATRYKEALAHRPMMLEEVYSRNLLRKWREFDWILCAAQSDGYLIEGKGREGQLILDLGVPRNVDPNIEGAVLWNLDQIHRIVEQDRLERREVIDGSENEVKQEVLRFADLYRQRRIGPLLKFDMARESGEGDHISDILHSRCQ